MKAFGIICFAAGFTALSGVPAWSDEITLVSPDGELVISGTLLGYDADVYRLDTVYGPLSVNAATVTCQGAACPDLSTAGQTVAISGATLPGNVLLPALLESFAQRFNLTPTRLDQSEDRFVYYLSNEQKGLIAAFSFHVSTTEEGFADLLANESDIVLAARPISDIEHRRAFEASLGDLRAASRSIVIGLVGLVPVASPGQRIKALTIAQLSDIYTGVITNWSDLGGADQPVRVHALPSDDGMQQALMSFLLTDGDVPVAMERHPDIESLTAAVGADTGAIGFTRPNHIGTTDLIDLRDDCGFVMPFSGLDLKTQSYPLVVPLIAYTPERRLPKIARDFLRFLRSPAAQIVVQRSGFGDQLPQLIDANGQGVRLARAILSAKDTGDLERLQTLAKDLTSARQLSLVIRLQDDGRFGPQSLSNLAFFAQMAQVGAFQEKNLTLAYFDAAQPSRITRTRLRRRVEDMQDVLREAPGKPDAVRVLNFTGVPQGRCDDPDHPVNSHGRIEIWVQ